MAISLPPAPNVVLLGLAVCHGPTRASPACSSKAAENSVNLTAIGIQAGNRLLLARK
jgi:hypothetical protein